MANNKQKLELTWIGKHNPEYDISNIEPRILEERTDLSYGDSDTENMIIHGDNLLALKALLPEYEGKIKCIYIDPPYNTGNAFEHYDDSVEHSTWLSLMKPRLELLRALLSDDGSIWISIDDDECHYFKVLCDEVFGRSNFVTSCIWQKIHSIKNDAKYLSENHDYILVYSKDKTKLNFNLLLRSEAMDARYKNIDNDERGPWQSGDLVANEERTNGYFEITGPTGKVFNVPTGKHWVYAQDTLLKMISENRIWFGKDGTAFPRKKRFLSEVQQGRKGDTWWKSDEVGHNQEAKREIKALFKTNIFDTPKPERLINRVISLCTEDGEFVLDSFLGSGTTAAVAHKMGRRYIGIEMGEHAYSHCKTRLDKVIDGSDQGGISKAVGWKSGGGYKFFELAPSFVTIDEFGNPVIDGYYNDTKLIRAMCKLTNYTFAPSPAEYWKQGKGQGNNSLYVTTQLLSVAMVQQIVQHLGPNETLLICPRKFEPGCADVDSRITIKKIPQSILKSCQFGKKEYLLPIKEQSLEECDEDCEEDDN